MQPTYPGVVHKTLGQRDPAAAFPLAHSRDDADERRQANRAVALSAVGLGVTGLAELLIADALGRSVADELSRQLPEAGSLTWTTRAAPA